MTITRDGLAPHADPPPTSDGGGLGDGILSGTEEARTIAPGVHLVGTQGNGLAVETQAGVVLVDAGPGGRPTTTMIEEVRRFTDLPVRAIVYSHGHVGYNTGVDLWVEHAASRGEPAPELIAHERCRPRYARYRETAGLQFLLNSIQFPKTRPEAMRRALDFKDPTVTFTDRLRLDDPERPIDLLAAPSETDDALAMWLPNQRILLGGASTPGATIPNVGTPLRTLRLTVRWADTLDRLAALGAETLVQEFGPVVQGTDVIEEQLSTMSSSLRWLRREVVARMNTGMTDVEIIHDLEYPADLFDHPYMAEVYGARDYIVRDLYREENGWWTTRNPTDLHPAAPDDAAEAIAEVVDGERALARAREHASAGDLQLALHVIDLVALCPGDDPVTRQAQEQKAEWCEQLGRSDVPFVSRSLYRGSAALLRAGIRRWSEAPDGVHSVVPDRPTPGGAAR